MAVDSNGVELKVGLKVVCVRSSVLTIPICVDPFLRPVKKSGVVISKDASEKRKYDSSYKYARLHTDMILTRKDAKREGRQKYSKILTIKDISNNSLLFYNDKDKAMDEVLYHFHPSDKFMVFYDRKKV